MTPDKIKEAFEAWCESAQVINPWKQIRYMEAWQACAEWILSQASGGFDEFWQGGNWLDYLGNYHRDEVAKEIWQAARLSCAKEIAEKDERIAKLEGGLGLLTGVYLEDAAEYSREMKMRQDNECKLNGDCICEVCQGTV